MRVRSNSKHSSTSMEIEKPKLKEETHLSGAYIRSLVKQLSSSRPRDLSKQANSAAAEDGRSQDERHGELAQKQQQQEASPQASQAPPHKKQVRRRLHTSKPYQERLLNMAEARREIVTALKFHRAAMKQAKEQQQQQQQQQIHNSQVTLLPSPPTSLDQEFPHEVMDPKANSSVRPLNYTFPNYFNGSPLISPLSYSSPFSYNHPSNATAPVLPLSDNFKIPFPNQPLGLNLNLQGFHDIQASFHTKPQLESLPSPSSSSSYSYSSPITATSSMDVGVVPSILTHHDQASRVAMEYPSSMSLHPVMDDAEMAEIHSIGKQHDMEWNDTVNLVTSAWWSKFLKDMEDNKDDKEGGGRGDKLSNSHVFDEVYDMQSCLSDGGGRDGNEGSLFQQQLDSYYHASEYQHDAALASLDIGELEGWEWLS